MADKNVWIVRYGLTMFPLVEKKGPYDSPIDPIEGVEHAKAIADRLASAKNSPTVVFASPFLRTAETAHIIAKACGCKVKIEEGLAEWQTPSLLVDESGARTYPRSTSELAKLFDTVDAGYTSRNPPNDNQVGAPRFPESEADLLVRCARTMDEILDETGSLESVAIVSHAPCDQSLAYCLEGALSPAESRLTPWPLGGITLFRGSELEMYGDTSHMPGIYRPGIKRWSLPCLDKPQG